MKLFRDCVKLAPSPDVIYAMIDSDSSNTTKSNYYRYPTLYKDSN